MNKMEVLIKHLKQEINWVEELNTLLAEEKIILISRQFDLLDELAEKKQELSEKIEESAKQRVTLIKASDNPDQMSLSLTQFLKNCSAAEANQINTLNNSLFELLATCRELNSVNGQVITNNIHTRQQIVNALSGNNHDAVSVYTATGNLKSSSDNNHHQEA